MSDTLSITVEQQTVYQVRNKGEWADINVKSGRSNPELYGRDTGWVKVSIHSSYGSYGHYWNSIGPRHWSDFLQACDMDYALNKMMTQGELYVFDAEASAKGLRQHILQERRHGWYSKEEAKAAWDDIYDIEHCNNEHDFTDVLANSAMFRDEYWEWCRKAIAPSAKGFWDRLWRPWIMSVANTESLRDAA